MSGQRVSLERMENLMGNQGWGTGATNKRDLTAAKAVLRTAIERELTGRQRECVRLYFFHGLTQEETAQALGISKPTVCRHLQRAKKRLGKAVYYAGTARRSLERES